MLAAAGVFGTSLEVVELPRRVGLPGVILAGTAQVRTPYILVYEHDWEIVRPINTSAILRTLAAHQGVQYIRLTQKRLLEWEWDFVLKPDVRRRNVPLMRTSCWSANPHFAKMSHYRRMILPYLSDRPEGGSQGFEERPFITLAKEIRAMGFDRAHRRWGVFVYGRLGDPPILRHLNGRWSGVVSREPTKAPVSG